MNKVRLATAWLDGCSGCHMSLLDMDAEIVAVAQLVNIVYGPLVDAQEFPEDVDITLVEGAVSSQEDLAKIQKIRAHTRVLVALGDCAITGNVPAMRNAIPVSRLMQRVYGEGPTGKLNIPSDGVPQLLPQACPLHDYVHVDLHLPGCPPSSQAILAMIKDFLAGRTPQPGSKAKFG